jgi:hypothetical protein
MWSLFFDAAWRVTIAGLIFGAGLPALFAVGVRASVLASGEGAAAGVESSMPPGVNRAIAITCYVLVVAAVAVGILIIIAAGLGKEVSFEHVFPTLVPKD